MLHRRIAFVIAIASSLPAALLAQQGWVLRSDHGSAGLVVADSSLRPRLLEPSPAPSAGAVLEFRGDGFHRRTDPLPAEFGSARAAAYDPVGQRIVVYCATVPQVAGPSSASVCVFDGARWSVLSTAGAAPSPRIGAVFTFDPQRGALVLFGGRATQTSGAPLGDTWELLGSTWTQLAASGPSPRFDAAIARTGPNGPLLLFGGAAASSVLDDTWLWNGTTWTQQAPSTVPPPRMLHAMANDPTSGRAVLFGGRSAGQGGLVTVRTDLWTWTGSDWQAQTPPPVALLVQPRLTTLDGALLLIGREPLTVAGQVVDQTTSVVHVQRRHAGAWSNLFASATVPATTLPMAAFDSVRGELVQFGGRDAYSNAYVARTATWNDGWTIHAPAVAPAARTFAGMAFDPLRGETVLFGGTAGAGPFADTWVWNGATWQPRSPANAPAGRYHTAMAWDPGRGAIVLFGGRSDTASFADTWTWDGTSWTQLPTATAPMALPGQLAFDHARQVLSLYIDRGSIAPSELWDLSAAGWVQASASAPALGRLVYDPAVAALALFAPSGRANFVGGTWVATPQPANGSYVVTDFARNAVLAGGPLVFQSTAMPAAAAAYGTGCGPLGEVTCSFDRAASFGAVVTADVRTRDTNTPTFLFFGTAPRDLPIGGGCSSYVDGLLVGLGALAGPHGWAAFPLAIPTTPALAGFELFAQAVTLHVGALGIGNGVSLRVGL